MEGLGAPSVSFAPLQNRGKRALLDDNFQHGHWGKGAVAKVRGLSEVPVLPLKGFKNRSSGLDIDVGCSKVTFLTRMALCCRCMYALNWEKKRKRSFFVAIPLHVFRDRIMPLCFHSNVHLKKIINLQ